MRNTLAFVPPPAYRTPFESRASAQRYGDEVSNNSCETGASVNRPSLRTEMFRITPFSKSENSPWVQVRVSPAHRTARASKAAPATRKVVLFIFNLVFVPT